MKDGEMQKRLEHETIIGFKFPWGEIDFLFIGQFWDLGKVARYRKLVKIMKLIEWEVSLKSGDKNIKSSLVVINYVSKNPIYPPEEVQNVTRIKLLPILT